MITSKEREILKETIGSQHIKKIYQHLLNRGVVRQGKDPYSRTQISNVFNGVSHEILEKNIYECAAYYKKKADRAAAKRAKALEKLKS